MAEQSQTKSGGVVSSIVVIHTLRFNRRAAKNVFDPRPGSAMVRMLREDQIRSFLSRGRPVPPGRPFAVLCRVSFLHFPFSKSQTRSKNYHAMRIANSASSAPITVFHTAPVYGGIEGAAPY